MNETNTKVSLGCGTLIIIALIVLFFGNSNGKKVASELKELRDEVADLRRAVEAQTAEIRLLREGKATEPAGSR